MDPREYFRGKRVTVMGLGVLGRGIGDVRFLAECGAELVVTDLKPGKDLASSVEGLKDLSGITYRLGGHDLEDFRGRDLILKAAGVPIDSPFIAEAKRNGIPVRMSADLFAELSGATIVGVTGTRGKSTVAHLTAHILNEGGKSAVLGGNIRGVSTLSLLSRARRDTIAVLELDSWQLQGFGEAKRSPHVSVFTTFFPDHLDYYGGDLERYFADKAHIFLHQNNDDYLILGEQVVPFVEEYGHKRRIAAHTEVVGAGDLPRDWALRMPGEHNRYDAALAMAAADALGIEIEVIRKAVETFPGVEGRLHYVGERKGVRVYNDNNSTTPEATIAALKALPAGLTLIMGGSDKNLDVRELAETVKERTGALVLLKGTGTERFKSAYRGQCSEFDSLESAVTHALSETRPGGTVLFSPAFASFGMFKNEYDRNDRFMALMQEL